MRKSKIVKTSSEIINTSGLIKLNLPKIVQLFQNHKIKEIEGYFMENYMKSRHFIKRKHSTKKKHLKYHEK